MLKHSINHYGSTGVPLQSPHQLTSSSHSADTSLHHHLHQQVTDPTRFLEGPPLRTHSHTHSHSVLDQSYPSVNNSRIFLDTSRISRKDDKPNGSAYFTSPQNVTSTNLNVTAASGVNPLDITTNPTIISGPHNNNNNSNNTSTASSSSPSSSQYRHGVLRSLSLLSVLSLLLALNSLVFLMRNVWPGGELGLLYEVTLCLTAMSLSINLCVLLVCSAQYFFAATGSPGTTSFLQKVMIIRGVAIGGFFLSIPLFLCAIVLYTFTHLTFSPPALIASGCVGIAIIFGGCAMVHHVFTWQREKTKKHVVVQAPPPTIELSTLV